MTAGTPTARTVLGDLAPDQLGVTNAHDHLFFASRRLPGQELDDTDAAVRELRAFARLGGRTVVQWSPFGLGRHPEALAEVSRSADVHVIAATGLHQAAHYPPELLARVRDRLAELFVAELTTGMHRADDPDGPTVPARAGLVKVAGGFHGLDAHARHALTAAAEAHHATGTPIAVHLEGGTAALDVLDLLCDRLDVPPHRVILGHLTRFPDPRVPRAAAEAGAFLALDGPSRAHHATDWRLFDVLTALVEAGHATQVLLGGDTTTAAARSVTGEGPGMPFLLTALRPRIERELGPEIATAIFEASPARAFATAWTAT
ncbi:phosphotriesterase family protein [Goodfellowiella coeruleoviolacea]|uniref:Phosphotriesterase-related protein n=1 Tax=Goodfellowiella coeruleoviolacea TaxID=334858 RepID=A0AAE3GPM2_9PSEU|nr:phosphotriesterase [Goodfellowiella coeruleoviolacea]MCP2169858.1 phosphotriesterase-related protein [Goodfellowiella coeruleoviolacea]